MDTAAAKNWDNHGSIFTFLVYMITETCVPRGCQCDATGAQEFRGQT